MRHTLHSHSKHTLHYYRRLTRWTRPGPFLHNVLVPRGPAFLVAERREVVRLPYLAASIFSCFRIQLLPYLAASVFSCILVAERQEVVRPLFVVGLRCRVCSLRLTDTSANFTTDLTTDWHLPGGRTRAPTSSSWPWNRAPMRSRTCCEQTGKESSATAARHVLVSAAIYSCCYI